MSFFKEEIYRSKRYLKWVAGLPCANCGTEDGTVIAHHLIGVGQGKMGGKASDKESMPLCYNCHAEIHLSGGNKQDQYEWIGWTIMMALKDGFKF